MSFDLFFCRKDADRPSTDEIARACERHPAFGQPDEGSEEFWVYENEATGVYFTLECEPWMMDDDAPETRINPPFVDAEMHAIINLFRPSFFGVETMNVIAEICRDLDLYVLDESGQVVPERLDAGELQRRWLDSNASALRLMASDSAVNHWSRARSDAWHRYQSIRKQIDDDLTAQGRGVFVPQLMLVVPVGAKGVKIQSMVVWPEAIPFVFPPCDLVAVFRKRKSFLRGEKEERCLLPASFVREQLKPLLQALETEAGTFDYLPEDRAASAALLVARWKLDVPMSSVERVSSDSFVDDLSE